MGKPACCFFLLSMINIFNAYATPKRVLLGDFLKIMKKYPKVENKCLKPCATKISTAHKRMFEYLNNENLLIANSVTMKLFVLVFLTACSMQCN